LSAWYGEGIPDSTDFGVSLPARQVHVGKKDYLKLPKTERCVYIEKGVKLALENNEWVISLKACVEVGDDVVDREEFRVVTLKSPLRKKDASFRVTSNREENDKEKATRACRAIMEKIAGAKTQWSMAAREKTGDTVVVEEVDKYIKGGHPKCPDGGEYVYGNVGETPKCTVHGTLE